MELVDHGQAREPVVKLVPEEDEDKISIFLEGMNYKAGQTVVAPVTVDQQQPPELTEAGDGEVSGHDGLPALLPVHAHPHVSCL